MKGFSCLQAGTVGLKDREAQLWECYNFHLGFLRLDLIVRNNGIRFEWLQQRPTQHEVALRGSRGGGRELLSLTL
jgi:hypothetical protein